MASVFKAGHTAVITGGASGVGLSLAKKFFGHGMKVLVADWDDETLGTASKNVGGDISTIKIDVSKTDDWAKLKSKVDTDFSGENRFPSAAIILGSQRTHTPSQAKSTSSPSTQV